MQNEAVNNQGRMMAGPSGDVAREVCPTTPEMTDAQLELICQNCTKRCLKHERAEMALDQVLGRIEAQRKEIGHTIQQNIETIVLPLLGDLEQSIPPHRRELVEHLRRQLTSIVDPFVDRISSSFKNLSPSELKVCAMIRNDMSTKDIARLLHLSPSTINRHREHIRKKLDLANKNVNLKRYLQIHFGG